MSIVLKIGGSNLRNAESLRQIYALIKSYKQPVILVVSAFNGLTDKLFEVVRQPRKDKNSIHHFLAELQAKYESILIHELTDWKIREEVIEAYHKRLSRLEDLLMGSLLIGGVPDFIEDEIVSFGERFSSLIIAAYLRQNGIQAKELLPEDVGLETNGSYHNASVNFEKSAPGFQNLDLSITYVVPGFYGLSAEKKVTVFGRGGSDYSAAAIAACIHASSLDVWKDVDGYLSGDPVRVENPKRIQKLSYTEAAELSYFGAKILHPRTVEPLKPLEIPIRIFNFDQSDSEPVPFTIIGPSTDSDGLGIKSVTSTEDIRTLTLRGAGVGITPGILSKVTNTLEMGRVNIKSVITTQVAISLLLSSSDMEAAHRLIEEMNIPGIDLIDESEELSLIAAVGEGVLNQPGIAAAIFSAVAGENINIKFISFGASRVAIYFLVGREDRDIALNAIHNELFCK